MVSAGLPGVTKVVSMRTVTSCLTLPFSFITCLPHQPGSTWVHLRHLKVCDCIWPHQCGLQRFAGCNGEQLLMLDTNAVFLLQILIKTCMFAIKQLMTALLSLLHRRMAGHRIWHAHWVLWLPWPRHHRVFPSCSCARPGGSPFSAILCWLHNISLLISQGS